MIYWKFLEDIIMKFSEIFDVSISILPSLKTIGIVLLIMLVLDAFWLGWFAKPIYTIFLKEINPTTPKHAIRIVPAVLSYLIMALTLSLLVIPLVRITSPTSSSNSSSSLSLLVRSFIFGGLGWGLTAYGIYNMTNLATIGVYPSWIVSYDVLWGVFLGTITSYLTVTLS
jgi:uncharacterized membrane protein